MFFVLPLWNFWKIFYLQEWSSITPTFSLIFLSFFTLYPGTFSSFYLSNFLLNFNFKNHHFSFQPFFLTFIIASFFGYKGCSVTFKKYLRILAGGLKYFPSLCVKLSLSLQFFLMFNLISFALQVFLKYLAYLGFQYFKIM